MILGTFIAINSGILATKMIYTKVDEKMNNEIINNGLYHVTTPENADKILESGYIKPSSNFISMGSKKCFFFAGKPSYNDLLRNVSSSSTSYEFSAVKIDLKKDAQNNEVPTEKAKEILSNFKQRSFNDDAIVYKGKYELNNSCATKVQMVLDLDEKGNIISREKTEEEIEKGEYVPSQELVDKLNLHKLTNNTKLNSLKSYPVEVKETFLKVFSKFKDMFTRNKNTKMLNPPNNDLSNLSNSNENVIADTSDFSKDLQGMVKSNEEIENIKSNEEPNLQKNIEDKENYIE